MIYGIPTTPIEPMFMTSEGPLRRRTGRSARVIYVVKVALMLMMLGIVGLPCSVKNENGFGKIPPIPPILLIRTVMGRSSMGIMRSVSDAMGSAVSTIRRRTSQVGKLSMSRALTPSSFFYLRPWMMMLEPRWQSSWVNPRPTPSLAPVTKGQGFPDGVERRYFERVQILKEGSTVSEILIAPAIIAKGPSNKASFATN